MSVKSELIERIQGYVALYYYVTPKYKEEVNDPKFLHIKKFLSDKQYMNNEPFNISVMDIIYRCDAEMFNKWKNKKKFNVNNIKSLMELSNSEYAYIRKHRDRLLNLTNGE